MPRFDSMFLHDLSRADFDKLLVPEQRHDSADRTYWVKGLELKSIGFTINCFTDEPPVVIELTTETEPTKETMTQS